MDNNRVINTCSHFRIRGVCVRGDILQYSSGSIKRSITQSFCVKEKKKKKEMWIFKLPFVFFTQYRINILIISRDYPISWGKEALSLGEVSFTRRKDNIPSDGTLRGRSGWRRRSRAGSQLAKVGYRNVRVAVEAFETYCSLPPLVRFGRDD